MKERITRKDGVTYERTPKPKNYNTMITLRLSVEEKEKLLKIAKENNTSYTELIRRFIYELSEE